MRLRSTTTLKLLVPLLLLTLFPHGGGAIQHAALGNPVQVAMFTASSLNVSWSDAPASYSYDLRWRPTGATEFVAGQELPGNVTSFVVSGLLPGTQYEMLLQVLPRPTSTALFAQTLLVHSRSKGFKQTRYSHREGACFQHCQAVAPNFP
jgi:hypothetical protein